MDCRLRYCCSYPRPRNFQVCRSSSAWSSVRRSAHTGGTTSAVRSSVKQSPTFWTANSNRPASVRISASRSLCSCAVGFKDHPQWDDRIVESRRANQRRRSIPACNFRNTSGCCPKATNYAFSSRGLVGRLADSEPAPPCAHASARAREIIEEFSLGSIASPVRTTASRARRYHADHADIGAGLVGAAWSSVMALSISEPRLASKNTSEARTGSEADRNRTPSAPHITTRLDA